MTKKNLVAVFLSAAMAASVMPASFAEGEETDQSGSETGGYLFSENFEGESHNAMFDLANGSDDFWRSEVATESDGNKYMRYYYDSSKTPAESQISAEAFQTLPMGQYEISFKALVQTARYATKIRIDAKPQGELLWIQNTNGNNINYFWTNKGYNETEWVDMIARVDTVNRRLLNYYKIGDTEYLYSSRSGNIQAAEMKLNFTLLLGKDIRNTTAERTFAALDGGNCIKLDDIKIRNITDDDNRTISFDVNGRSVATPESMKTSDATRFAINPDEFPKLDDTEDEYFMGWYTDAACTNKATPDTTYFKDSVVYAKWAPKYKVTLNYIDATGATQDVTVGKTNRVSLPAPEQEGITFEGWYTDEDLKNKFDPLTKVYENMNLYAKWLDDSELVEITFNMNGGEPMDSIKVVPGERRLPKAPDKTVTDDSGTITEKFIGWYTDSALTQKFSSATGNMTVYAKYDRRYLAYEDFETTEYNPMWNVLENSGVNYNDGNKQSFHNSLANDADGNGCMEYLYEKTVDSPSNKQMINAVPGISLEAGKEYEIGFKFYPYLDRYNSAYVGIPWTGFSFRAKTSNNRNIDIFFGTGSGNFGQVNLFGTKLVTNNMKISNFNITGYITAKVMVNTSTGEVRQIITYPGLTEPIERTLTNAQLAKLGDGETITMLNDIIISGSEYETGYVNSSDVGFKLDDVYVKEASDECTVTFDAGEGNINGVQTTAITTSSGVITAPVPIRDGYHFDGWFFEDGVAFNPMDVAESGTVYARWSKIYTVSFNTNLEEITVDPIETYTGEIELPDTPVREDGYGFVGWYKDEAFTEEFDGKNITSDMTVYARWSDYTFYYDYENGIPENMGLYKSINATTGEVLNNDAELNGWSGEIREIDGNNVMAFQYDGSEITNQTVSLIKNQIENACKMQIKRDETDNPKSYEMGFRFNINDCTFWGGIDFSTQEQVTHAPQTLLGINIMPQSKKVGFTGLYYNPENQEYESYSIPFQEISSGWIDVRAIVTLDSSQGAVGKLYLNYTSTGGEIKEIEKDYVISGFVNKTNNTFKTTRGAILFHLGHMLWRPVTEVGTNPIYIDDIFFRPVKTFDVTFNSNGGSAIDMRSTNLFNEVVLPPEPTKDGYSFAGWFRDEALTVPFNGKNVYENMTVYARWQTAPEIADSAPADQDTGVKIRPEVLVNFNSELNADSIKKDTIWVFDMVSGVQLADEDYNVESYISPENRNTTIKITFNKNLDFAKKYAIMFVAENGVTNYAGGLSKDAYISFTTENMNLMITDVKATNANNETVTSLADVAGQRINVSFKLTSASASKNFLMSVYSFMSEKKLNAVRLRDVTKEEGETEATVTAEIAVPSDAAEGDTLSMLLLEDVATLKPATGKTEIIK